MITKVNLLFNRFNRNSLTAYSSQMKVIQSAVFSGTYHLCGINLKQSQTEDLGNYGLHRNYGLHGNLCIMVCYMLLH